VTAVLRILIYIAVGLPVLVIVLHTIIRIVRHFYKFPMPQFMANLIDNPFRHKIQPPDATPARHGIEPGMTVLEVGPGNGTYTVATARRVGDSGKVVTIDIEPKMIERVTRRAQTEGIDNIEAKIANVYDLPFEDGSFDAIYMIAVIGEIPEPDRALREFHRVLSPSGTLAFSEFLQDPDYLRAGTLIRKAASGGFQLKKKVGNIFYYTLILEKAREM
jgi:ubiquinone/menaquinone biosynthesis C-methylase UbiE